MNWCLVCIYISTNMCVRACVRALGALGNARHSRTKNLECSSSTRRIPPAAFFLICFFQLGSRLSRGTSVLDQSYAKNSTFSLPPSRSLSFSFLCAHSRFFLFFVPPHPSPLYNREKLAEAAKSFATWQRVCATAGIVHSRLTELCTHLFPSYTHTRSLFPLQLPAPIERNHFIVSIQLYLWTINMCNKTWRTMKFALQNCNEFFFFFIIHNSI